MKNILSPYTVPDREQRSPPSREQRLPDRERRGPSREQSLRGNSRHHRLSTNRERNPARREQVLLLRRCSPPTDRERAHPHRERREDRQQPQTTHLGKGKDSAILIQHTHTRNTETHNWVQTWRSLFLFDLCRDMSISDSQLLKALPSSKDERKGVDATIIE